MAAAVGHAQYALGTADGRSGIISNSETSAINYDVARSRVGASIDFSHEAGTTTVRTCEDGKEIVDLAPYKESRIDFGFAANDGKRDLVEGGEVVPGGDLAYTFAISRDVRERCDGRKAARAYDTFFIRMETGMREQDVARISGANVFSSDKLNGEALVSIGFNAGLLSGGEERLVVAPSVAGGFQWNSFAGLRSRRVCATLFSGTDGAGNPVAVLDCKDRTIGRPDDDWVLRPRVDVTYNIGRIAGPVHDPENRTDSPTIGLIGSVWGELRQGNRTTLNAAFGPTLHPSGHPSDVVVAILAEVIDATNELETQSNFDERLRLRAYIGVPFNGIEF